jgi:hypothetical protein
MRSVVLYAKFALLFFKGDTLGKSSKENTESWKNSAAKGFVVKYERRIQ